MWHSGPWEVAGGFGDSHSQQHPLSYLLSTENVFCFPDCMLSHPAEPKPTIQFSVYAQHESKTAKTRLKHFFHSQKECATKFYSHLELHSAKTVNNFPGSACQGPSELPHIRHSSWDSATTSFKIKFFKFLLCSNHKTEKPMQAVWLLGDCVLFLSYRYRLHASSLDGWIGNNWLPMPGVLSCVQLMSVLELSADLVDIMWNLTRRLRSQAC